MSIFRVSDYVGFLQEKIKGSAGIRGYQGQLAAAAGVHGSYLSRVLRGQVHLTPDQAARLNEFWRLKPDEAEAFLLLVNHARAATPALRAMLERRLADLRKANEEVAKRLPHSEALLDEARGLYYSAWHYSAVHMLLMLPGSHTPRTLARRLDLGEATVSAALEVLSQIGVARRTGSSWTVQTADLHLARQSPWAPVYHAMMRQRAASRAFKAEADDLQYSGLHAISEKDFGAVKEAMLAALEKIRAIAGPSKEEDVFYVSLDAFRI